jgi:hypothetical protein
MNGLQIFNKKILKIFFENKFPKSKSQFFLKNTTDTDFRKRQKAPGILNGFKKRQSPRKKKSVFFFRERRRGERTLVEIDTVKSLRGCPQTGHWPIHSDRMSAASSGRRVSLFSAVSALAQRRGGNALRTCLSLFLST